MLVNALVAAYDGDFVILVASNDLGMEKVLDFTLSHAWFNFPQHVLQDLAYLSAQPPAAFNFQIVQGPLQIHHFLADEGGAWNMGICAHSLSGQVPGAQALIPFMPVHRDLLVFLTGYLLFDDAVAIHIVADEVVLILGDYNVPHTDLGTIDHPVIPAARHPGEVIAPGYDDTV
jgi:hypothetical protein